MRGLVIFAGLIALTGCKTAGDLRARGPIAEVTTSKSTSEVAGCIALAVATSGVETEKHALANGVAVTTSMRVGGIKTVMDLYEVEDLGVHRRVTVFSVGGRGPAQPVISGPAASCI